MREKRIRFAAKKLDHTEDRMKKEIIRMKKFIFLVLLFSLFAVVAGCASYGKLRLQSGPGETMTTQQLKMNWQQYHVLGTGVEPNVPSAILFDRKDDDRTIIGDRWWVLQDSQAVSDMIGRIESQQIVAQYYPRLWKMLGPDDYLYGYMLTAWDHATMIIGDDKTMRVFDLPMPPFLAVSGGPETVFPR